MKYTYRLILLLLCALSAAVCLTSCGFDRPIQGPAQGADVQKANEQETKKQETKKQETNEHEAKEQDTKEQEAASLEHPAAEVGNTELNLPAFSHSSGCYADAFTLSITAQAGRYVVYTTDGSDPRASETAVVSQGASAEISVTDRKDDTCLLATLDPSLFDAANCKLNSSKTDFVSKARKPKDLDVDKCTVVRAASCDREGNYSQIVSNTYFIGVMSDHIQGIEQCSTASGTDLAVVSIITDSANLFDPTTGIYVRGDIFNDELARQIAKYGKVRETDARNIDANYKQRGRAWEREVHVDLFEANPDSAECVLSQDCGIRIQGNYSRSDLIKGFRLYARSDYGPKNFKYPVFGESHTDDAGSTLTKFKSLTLRNGGNCAFTTKYSDTFWQGLVADLDCETQASRPAIVYINGEYWGLYILQEDYSADYFADTHGVNKNAVVVYKGDAEALALGYKLDEGELPEGVTDERFYFADLLKFFDTHDSLADMADYDEFVKLVDPESVRDYFAVECWINNKWDWPGKNWSMWRVASDAERAGERGQSGMPASEGEAENIYNDGRWRFCFYDMEFGGVSGASDAYTNTIKEDNYKPKGLLDMNTENPAVLCFAYLMTNSAFKADFRSKLVSLSQNEFEKTAAIAALDRINDIYSPLYDQFFSRFPGTGSAENSVNGGYASCKCIRDFLKIRAENIGKMIMWIP